MNDTTYRVIGDSLVQGRGKGHVFTEEDLADVNVPALIQGGHIQEQQSKPAAPSGKTDEKE